MRRETSFEKIERRTAEVERHFNESIMDEKRLREYKVRKHHNRRNEAIALLFVILILIAIGFWVLSMF